MKFLLGKPLDSVLADVVGELRLFLNPNEMMLKTFHAKPEGFGFMVNSMYCLFIFRLISTHALLCWSAHNDKNRG